VKVDIIKIADRSFGNQWAEEVEDRWDYDVISRDPAWRRDWISVDCACYIGESDRLYLGVTSFDADILKVYDRPSRSIVDPGYHRVADRFDAKFHRSLVRDRGTRFVYGAIALLHDVDSYWEAPGGAIVRIDTETGEIRKLGVPMPHVYIQSICLDPKRNVIYGMTFTPERLIRYHIDSGRCDDLGPIGSGMAMAQGENIELDDEGCAWCGWNLTRAWQSSPGSDSARLCKFDPKADRIIYYKEGLPAPDGNGFARVEGLFNLGTGCLYASGANGSIYRIDTDTGKAEYLGTPIADRPSRLASLRLGPDGKAYGVTGRAGDCRLLRLDPETGAWELLGEIAKEGDRCYQVHDVAIAGDGVVYACENDNPYRSSWLWEIVV
jgi:outer membrane protein assembly factor BamB